MEKITLANPLPALFAGIVRLRPVWALVIATGSLLLAFLAMSYVTNLPRQGPFPTAAGVVVWGIGCFCPLYVMWSAARAVVFVEEGGKVDVDRRIGTFLLFYFLPLGNYFVQRRFQRVVR